jgi:hypothetical protein
MLAGGHRLAEQDSELPRLRRDIQRRSNGILQVSGAPETTREMTCNRRRPIEQNRSRIAEGPRKHAPESPGSASPIIGVDQVRRDHRIPGVRVHGGHVPASGVGEFYIQRKETKR